ELVGEHTLEELGMLFGAGDRDADAAVVLPRGPSGRPRDVAELLFGVQHGDDRGGGKLSQPGADAAESEVENVGRLSSQLLLLAAFEQHAELVVAALVERAVHVGFAPPFAELTREPRVAGRILQRVLVSPDRQIDVAFGVSDLPEQPRSRSEARIE